MYSGSEMERMMKLQDVLLRAMAKKITWWQAAEIIGVTDRTMRRWAERLEEDGYSGLADPAQRQTELPARAAKDVRRSAAAVSGEVVRSEHAAFSREAQGENTLLN
jgi:hypothetical protein